MRGGGSRDLKFSSLEIPCSLLSGRGGASAASCLTNGGIRHTADAHARPPPPFEHTPKQGRKREEGRKYESECVEGEPEKLEARVRRDKKELSHVSGRK